MNDICKSYISDVKALFPVKGKEERKFIKKITSDIEDYIIESGVQTKEELYKGYGDPKEFINEYISKLDTEAVVKRIKTAKFIRRAGIIILCVIVILSTLICLYLYRENKILDSLEGIHVEEVIHYYSVVE